MQRTDIKPCPFCGWAPVQDLGLDDVLYPNGAWWADITFYGKSYRVYRSHKEREEGDRQCWTMHCNENMGGCGAEVSGHSEDEAAAKWNRRAPPNP